MKQDEIRDEVERSLNYLWKQGLICRTETVETEGGEYMWAKADFAGEMSPRGGGRYVTYEEFMGELQRLEDEP